jgi:hypothetical protein
LYRAAAVSYEGDFPDYHRIATTLDDSELRAINRSSRRWGSVPALAAAISSALLSSHSLVSGAVAAGLLGLVLTPLIYKARKGHLREWEGYRLWKETGESEAVESSSLQAGEKLNQFFLADLSRHALYVDDGLGGMPLDQELDKARQQLIPSSCALTFVSELERRLPLQFSLPPRTAIKSDIQKP